MKLMGITGGVGMGKSAAQSLLMERGLPVVDTDQLARALVEPGQPAFAEIQAQFGSDVLHPDGTLRREVLAQEVFSDSEARQRLESILHPGIRAGWHAEVARWRSRGIPVGAVVIPLLFETDASSFFDLTVCVACSAGVQNDRLQARGWSETEIQQRRAAQWNVERKMASADRVVWTDGTLPVHAAQWTRILGSVE